MLDNLLIISNNQYVSSTSPPGIFYRVSDHYVDLGTFSIDQWGTGRVTRPGWWIPDNLTLVWKLSSTVPITDSGASSHGEFFLWGTNDPAEVKTEPDESKAYIYLKSGSCLNTWPKAYPHALLYQATVPRIFHRYIFVEYQLYAPYYAYYDLWLGIGQQFLVPAKYPVYPGNTE